MKILGFDVSSTTIGIGLIETNPLAILKTEFYKPPKNGHIAERLLKVKIFISEKIEELKPDFIVVEDILLGAGGVTTIKTLAALAIFNRTVCLSIFEKTNSTPGLLNVLKIRHCLKLDKELPHKSEMPSILEKHFNSKWNFLLDKKGKQKSENFDMADAVAVALAYHKISEKEKQKNGSKKSKRNTGNK